MAMNFDNTDQEFGNEPSEDILTTEGLAHKVISMSHNYSHIK